MNTPSTISAIRRRSALAGLAGAAISLATGSSVQARGPSVRSESLQSSLNPKYLNLVVARTGESFADVFAAGDRYDNDGLARLNRLLRDYRTGEVKSVDPALFDLLARVQAQVGQPLRVLSGYRSPETNHLLHMAGFDVAENSLHISAKAVDFSVTGVPVATLGDIARQCGAGGIGLYRSGFIHVDTGPVRNWSGE